MPLKSIKYWYVQNLKIIVILSSNLNYVFKQYLRRTMDQLICIKLFCFIAPNRKTCSCFLSLNDDNTLD